MSKPAKRTPLEKLMKHWARASRDEQQRFLQHIASALPLSIGQEGSGSSVETDTLIANGRYLLPSTVRRIEAVLRRRNLTPAEVMQEMGFSRTDPALTRALARRSSLRLTIVSALAAWLADNER